MLEKEQMEISKGRKGQIKASNVSRSQNQEFQYLVTQKARKPIFGKPQVNLYDEDRLSWRSVSVFIYVQQHSILHKNSLNLGLKQ